MHVVRLLAASTLVLTALGCVDAPPTAPNDAVTAPASAALARAPRNANLRLERLARRTARALRDPEFRAYVKDQLDRSPVVEHKLHFQRFLAASNRRGLRTLARADRESDAAVELEARDAIPLEMYFPVPAHRTRWTGDTDILVATAVRDGEAPVAFDLDGKRRLLDPRSPPTTPVLAIEPVETDFDARGRAGLQTNCPDTTCDVGSGGGSTPPAGTTPAPPTGLFMTYAHFVDDFEGWLKGSPEFEIHILGQSGATDSLKSYQCAGEHAGGAYAFDMNGKDWSGNVLLFSQAQLNAYRTQHPNQSFRIVAFEDDDGACQLRLDRDRLKKVLTAVSTATSNKAGAKDTTGTILSRRLKNATSLLQVITAIYSFLTSADEIVGNAIEDAVAGLSYPGANWIVKGDNNVTNGWLKLEMR